MDKPFGFNLEYTYTDLPSLFYQSTVVDRLNHPRYCLFNAALAEKLELDKGALNTPEGVRFLSAQAPVEKQKIIAMAYAGHQYGQFTLLGDGRASLLGEHRTDKQRFDVHLKGSGPTRYSRGFDGKATLRSCLLEYLFSEALFALGTQTTRSLAVIQTDEKVRRVREEARAVLVRVAKSHLRVGTFEYAAYHQDIEMLRTLVEYAIKRHDSELIDDPHRVTKWYLAVVKRQAELVAKWQSIGFVHGVMNTDNTTISGETIDYGPCAFIDTYDLQAVYSSIDVYGRYAFGQQPYIMSWNIAKLGEVILPLIDEDNTKALKKVQSILGVFGPHFENSYYALMAKKIGITLFKDKDKDLINRLLRLLESHKVDYTYFFYALTYQNTLEVFKQNGFVQWFKDWRERLTIEIEPFETMRTHNPLLIPRNHLVKEALDNAAFENDYRLFNQLLKAVQNPYTKTSVPQHFIEPPKNQVSHITYCGT